MAPSERPRCSSSTATAGSCTTGRSTTRGKRTRSRSAICATRSRPCSRARSQPSGTPRRSAARSSGSRRAPDELERLLARRDRSGGALLGDHLEQAADLGARREAELVASEQGLARLVLARDEDLTLQLGCADEDERV